jgi:hypothetical protein
MNLALLVAMLALALTAAPTVDAFDISKLLGKKTMKPNMKCAVCTRTFRLLSTATSQPHALGALARAHNSHSVVRQRPRFHRHLTRRPPPPSPTLHTRTVSVGVLTQLALNTHTSLRAATNTLCGDVVANGLEKVGCELLLHVR